MCSTHFTLSCRILLFSLPTTNNFFKFLYSEITGQRAWQILFRALLWQFRVIRTWLTSILNFWYLGPSYFMQEVLVLYFVFNVLCTKNLLKSTPFSRYSTTFFFWPFYSFLQNWVITEVLVCSIYGHYESIVLANSIRLLYFHVCFPVFPPFVDSCCVVDHTYHLHKSCPSLLAPLCHHSSRMPTSLFSSTFSSYPLDLIPWSSCASYLILYCPSPRSLRPASPSVSLRIPIWCSFLCCFCFFM